MRNVLPLALILTAFVAAPGAAVAQADDSDSLTRGWITERPRERRQARPHRSPARPSASQAMGAAPVPLAIGYTLYKLETDWKAVSVTPDTAFKVGDRVRLRIEPNV